MKVLICFLVLIQLSIDANGQRLPVRRPVINQSNHLLRRPVLFRRYLRRIKKQEEEEKKAKLLIIRSDSVALKPG